MDKNTNIRQNKNRGTCQNCDHELVKPEGYGWEHQNGVFDLKKNVLYDCFCGCQKPQRNRVKKRQPK